MKAFCFSTIGMSGLCVALALTSASAQVPPAPAALPAPPSVPAPPPAVAPPEEESHDLHKIVERAQRDVALEMARAHSAQEEAHKALSKVKGDIRWMAGNKGGRVLIIPSSEPEADTVSHLEEDLTIMGRLIEKAVGSKERQPKALGIDVLTFAGPGGAQYMYVGGHGAIFTLRVRFPLSPPPAEAAKDEKQPETNSTWEEARREVFGPSGFERNVFGAFKEFDRALKDNEEYDAAKVEQLKDSIIDSLKHASQIRHLPADEHVTVVVTTGAGGVFESRMRTGGFGRGGGYAGGGAAQVEEVRQKIRPETVLTIQARKSDVDAFTKGSLDSDAFRKKVTVMRY